MNEENRCVKTQENLKLLFIYRFKYSTMWIKIYIMCILLSTIGARVITKRSYSDESVTGYLTERTCWSNEICKEEFQSLFRCKCPSWSFCRSPGRYYNAFCSMTETGYIWTQPEKAWKVT